MTERTRYRLTGGIFLLALAGIVLPMLFDGAGIESIEVPPVDPIVSTPFDVAPPTLDEEALAEAAALRERIDDEGFDASTGIRIGEPNLTDADAPARVPVDAWAVQVASFNEHGNAVALRDQLRRDGYASFLSEMKRNNGRTTRVAVGPIVERPEAERLRDALAQRYSNAAIVVRFEQ